MKISKYVYIIITPLSIGGAVPKSVEIRPSSIKGAMRFWWRALNADFPLNKLKEIEGSIFGSTNEKQGKSNFNLRVFTPNLNRQDYSPVFHLQGRGKITAFLNGQNFRIILSSTGNDQKHQLYENILTLGLMLGGLGKRSRRGFGSVQLHSLNEEEVSGYDTQEEFVEKLYKLLDELKPGCFLKQNNKISSTNKFAGDYPWIREIEIGKAYTDYTALLKNVSIAAHQFDSDYTGMARQGNRLASPIYVSVVKTGQDYRPIVTTLNTAFKPGLSAQGTNTQGQFKGAIL